MKKIAIVGFGFVGKGMYRLFEKQVAAVYDPFSKDIPTSLGTTKAAVNDCDMAIICVPTAESKDGACDTSLVEESVAWLKTPLIVIKSTVPPGTTDKLVKKTGKNIIFSPEFIGESSYYTPPWKYPDPQEVKMHTWQIFGGAKDITQKVYDIFIRIMGPHVYYAQTDAKTAEMVKYLENSWGAMKVIFFNEWFDICKTHGVDYREVRELWALDPRTEKMHTAVFVDKRGFGGKCFPKDVSAIIKATEDLGYEPKMMKMVKKRNAEFSKLNPEK
jgi:UDPglucose 6-dehydrogenase